jgi:hypothetical protein
MLRTLTFEDCLFEDSTLGALESVAIEACSFKRTLLAPKDGIYRSSIERSLFADCRLDHSQFVDVRIGMTTFSSLKAKRVLFDKCDIRDTSFGGRASTLIFTSSSGLRDVDLSQMLLKDSSIAATLSGHIGFPVHPDCFVVPRSAIKAAKTQLKTEIGHAALALYSQYAETLAEAFVVIDKDTFKFSAADLDEPMSAAEAATCVQVLFEYRVSSFDGA